MIGNDGLDYLRNFTGHIRKPHEYLRNQPVNHIFQQLMDIIEAVQTWLDHLQQFGEYQRYEHFGRGEPWYGITTVQSDRLFNVRVGLGGSD